MKSAVRKPPTLPRIPDILRVEHDVRHRVNLVTVAHRTGGNVFGSCDDIPFRRVRVAAIRPAAAGRSASSLRRCRRRGPPPDVLSTSLPYPLGITRARRLESGRLRKCPENTPKPEAASRRQGAVAGEKSQVPEGCRCCLVEPPVPARIREGWIALGSSVPGITHRARSTRAAPATRTDSVATAP